MIPWIVALVVVSIGLGALLPDHVFGSKSESQKESQGEFAAELADHVQPPGRQSHSSDYLVPPPVETAIFLGLVSSLVCIDSRKDRPPVEYLRDFGRSRAPPVSLSV